MKRIALLAVSAALAILPAAAPVPVSHSGELKGLTTVDKIEFSRDIGETIDFYVCATGSGYNKLRVRLQQKSTIDGSWGTVRDFELAMGDERTGRYVVANSGPIPFVHRDLRFLVSRKVGTKKIAWQLRYWP